MTTHRSPKPAARRDGPGPARPDERAVTAALVLSVVAGVGWVGGMIYTVLEWPL
ncbi:morphogenic membrane protein MmpA [Streptomyces sp. NPDC048448]|uniref:morphogenic membrane protein MmpA n=1 Tax=Streptomyces sp. NPDC048448 TaxID=3365554 RepID=UPI003722E000